MLGVVLSLLATFATFYHYRDRVWTPTFEGDQTRRFARAMSHYHDKMGLTDTLAFDFHAKRERKEQRKWCASVESSEVKVDGFHTQVVVLVSWYGGNRTCGNQKPEYWALHESCHLRMMHHRGQGQTDSIREAEAAECMQWYSVKERR